MPGRCSVPGCDKEVGGHVFPAKTLIFLTWCIAVKREDPATKKLYTKYGKKAVVCSAHFVPSDYRPAGLMDQRKRLWPHAVPSIFPHRKAPSQSSIARATRIKKREADREAEEEVTEFICLDDSIEQPRTEQEEAPVVLMTDGMDLQEEVVVDKEEPMDSDSAEKEPIKCDVAVQCEPVEHVEMPIKVTVFCIEAIKDKPELVCYYTSFSNYEHFMFVFQYLGPATTQLNYQCDSLTPVNQFLSTLMKLRQALDDLDLGTRFGVCRKTAGTVIQVWVNFMYYELRQTNIWPSKKAVEQNMPKNFGKMFPKTRVVLDATEIPVAKPSDVDLQSATFSTYKHRNTAKTLIGISPAGAVTFISNTYGGCTTDRQIVERSTLCKTNLLQTGDSIMADRGLMVQDLFAVTNVQVNTPHMLKGKSQLDEIEVIQDRRVSSKRIHVERIIGLAKTYKILKKELPPSKRQQASKIVFVCFALSNLREAIVGPLA